MPRINPQVLHDFIQGAISQLDEALELSRNNDLTDALQHLRDRLETLARTTAELLED
jgi:hypothetical protein